MAVCLAVTQYRETTVKILELTTAALRPRVAVDFELPESEYLFERQQQGELQRTDAGGERFKIENSSRSSVNSARTSASAESILLAPGHLRRCHDNSSGRVVALNQVVRNSSAKPTCIATRAGHRSRRS
jgi:hypothetical protein